LNYSSITLFNYPLLLSFLLFPYTYLTIALAADLNTTPSPLYPSNASTYARMRERKWASSRVPWSWREAEKR